jgi:predicted NBD/HSP70 family sugar kinase
MFASTRATLRFYSDLSGASAPATISQLVSLADAGDRCARKALRNQALQFGRGLQIVVTALAPELIIANIDMTLAWPEFTSIVQAELSSHMLAGEPPRLMVMARSELTRLRGAAAMVLQRHSGYHSYQYSAINGRAIPTRKVNNPVAAEGYVV